KTASCTPKTAGSSAAGRRCVEGTPPETNVSPSRRRASSCAPRATRRTSCPARAIQAAVQPPIAPAPTTQSFTPAGGLADDQRGHLAAREHLVGDRAEDDAAEAAHPARAHDDERELALGRERGDRLARIAEELRLLERDALGGEHAPRRRERLLALVA